MQGDKLAVSYLVAAGQRKSREVLADGLVWEVPPSLVQQATGLCQVETDI